MIQCSWNQPQGIKLGRSHFRSQSYFSTIYSKVILESNVSVLLSQDQCLDQSWISQVPFHWSSSRILLTETRTEWEGPGTRWLPGCSWRVVPLVKPAVRASRWRWSICPKVKNNQYVSTKFKTFFQIKLNMLYKLVNSVIYQKRLKWFTRHVLDTWTYKHRKKPVIGRGSSCINYVIQSKHKEISS